MYITSLSVYENELMADKTEWCSHNKHINGTYILGRIPKSPDNVTVKDNSEAQSAASKVVKVNETDSISNFSEVGSVTFYWKMLNEDVALQIPEVISASVAKDCKAAGLIHIGIMTDGYLNMIEIDKLRVVEGNIDN